MKLIVLSCALMLSFSVLACGGSKKSAATMEETSSDVQTVASTEADE